MFLSISTSVINLTTAFKNSFQVKKKLNQNRIPLEIGHGKITDFKIPNKIEIGTWHRVFAAFSGTVNSAFFSLKIEDSEGNSQWFEDRRSVRRHYGKNGQIVESGALNFTNGSYSNEWSFKVEIPLKAGNGKAIIAMYEDRDSENSNGQITHDRPQIDLVERNIMLF